MGNQPLVSIVINNYNYGQFLREAIESALNQTYPNVEVIVVDDGSTDSSRDVIEEYALLGKVVPVYKENGGQASAFNAGFGLAKGTWIFLLDSDDWFFAEKVERVLDALLRFPEAGWLVHPLIWRFANGSERLAIRYPRTAVYDFRQTMRAKGKLGAHFSATSGLIFSRQVLDKILPVPESLRITADNYLKFAAAAVSPVLLFKEPLAVQRIHEHNAYTLRKNTLVTINLHLEIAKHLSKRLPGLEKFTFRLGSRQVALAIKNGLYREAWNAAQQTALFSNQQALFVWTRALLLLPKLFLEEMRSVRISVSSRRRGETL